MSKHNIYLISWLLFLSLFSTAPTAVSADVSDVENLLRGTKYEQLLAERENMPRALGEKGFLPKLGN